MRGVLPVDKPAGFTSFDVVAKLRGMAKTKKVGHAGTLDPAATGVLPLFLGSATRFIDHLPDHDKTYRAQLQLGVVTDTQDLTGAVLEENPVTVSQKEVAAALSAFVGKGEQLPPMYSAVRRDGVRLYDLARQGLEVERTPRPVHIYRIDLVEAQEAAGLYTLEVACSRGTYIRTLCHDVGQVLGCGAAMGSLRRTRACGLELAGCRTLEELQMLAARNRLEEALLPVERMFSALPRLALDEGQAALFENGVKLALNRLPPLEQTTHAVFWGDRFLGLASPAPQEGCLRHVRRYPDL